MTIRSKNPVRILGLLFAFGLLLVMITGCGTSKTIMINSEPPIPVPVDVRGHSAQEVIPLALAAGQ